MIQNNVNYKLSREESAEKLGVSLRTLDRYLKVGKLAYVKFEEEGQLRILVSENEVKALVEKQKRGKKSVPVNSEEDVISEQGSAEKAQKQAQNLSQGDAVAEVYRRLYEETNQRLGEASRRLEGANYRVGELEAQLKSSVPLLEYRETQEQAQKLTQKVEKLNQEVAEGAIVNYRLTEEISMTRRQIDLEKSKRVLYITLLVLFVILGSFGLFWQNLT